MTISIAWVRKVGSTEELVLATDSRLGGFGRWDCCPKLFALPRQDSAICFAGNTMYAYPILLQFIAAIEWHPKIKSRAYDVLDLKGYLLNVMNSMVGTMHDFPVAKNHPETVPDATFLLAGWSWRASRYYIWTLHFDSKIKRFTFRPARKWAGRKNDKIMAFTGDYEDEFKNGLIDLLRQNSKLESGSFNMEPFEVLRNMLRESNGSNFDAIGGAPQLMKVYKHANCLPFATYWPDKKSEKVSLMGRPLLDFESSKYLLIDPDTLEIGMHADFVRNRHG